MPKHSNAGDVPHPSPAPISAVDALLGGLPATEFLARFWQKEALCLRRAVPGAGGLFSVAQLFALAERDGVESRLVLREGRRWTLAHGPFHRRDLKALPARDWTLLIQGVNLYSRAADELLRRFCFLPWARLDDLMVSCAAPGGGVGPHFDSYDVFLLQGFGRRRWRYGRQDDLSLRPDLPLKILKRFAPQENRVLGPGDMLYLPPHYAHEGVAVDMCTTYSIGFRAPDAGEVAVAFLDYLRDEIQLAGGYTDPDLTPTTHPARIDPAMVRRHAQMLAGIRWGRETVARFLGCWLSEPKPAVFFERPAKPLALAAFAREASRRGLRLDLRTQLLYDARHLFINGTALPWPAGSAALRRLADDRRLPARDAAALPGGVNALLHDWYCNGFLFPDTTR